MLGRPRCDRRTQRYRTFRLNGSAEPVGNYLLRRRRDAKAAIAPPKASNEDKSGMPEEASGN